MVERWIVVHTKPGREKYAAENVAQQGVRVYCPQIVASQAAPYKRGLTVERAVPLFPRYIFASIAERWRFILSSWGVSGVIVERGFPVFLRSGVIESLRAREDADGMILLPTVGRSSKFKSGQMVRIIAGPFEGYCGIHQGSTPNERQRVLLDCLGRKVSPLFAEEQLQAA